MSKLQADLAQLKRKSTASPFVSSSSKKKKNIVEEKIPEITPTKVDERASSDPIIISPDKHVAKSKGPLFVLTGPENVPWRAKFPRAQDFNIAMHEALLDQPDDAGEDITTRSINQYRRQVGVK